MFRCLVIAWRVMSAPAVRRAMERGPPEHRRPTRSRRVLSPKAANIAADPRMSPVPWTPPELRVDPPPGFARSSGVLGDMSLDVAHLDPPAFRVTSEGRVAALERNAVEAGFRDFQERASGNLGELEGHQGSGLP